MIARYWIGLLLSFAAFGCADAPTSSHSGKILIGAIRWDAWYGSQEVAGRTVLRTLGPEKWHDRLPFFARVDSEGAVEFPGYSESLIGKEIQFANQGHIDYWAFVLYEEVDPSSKALQFYLESNEKSSLRFSVVIGPWLLKSAESRSRLTKRLSLLARNPAYARVANERALVFLYDNNRELESLPGSVEYFRNLRDVLTKASGTNPYFALMTATPELSKDYMRHLGVDAVTAYQVHEDRVAAPYSELTIYTEKFWDRCEATGKNVIPVTMTGWDRRPRIETPVPWEPYQKPGIGLDLYYQQPSPQELSKHFSDAIQWVVEHPLQAPARTILAYAWNENDEGGWLVPSLGAGSLRIQAIGSATLRSAQ